MKRLLLLLFILAFWFNSKINSQTATVISVADTRAENPLPGAFSQEARFDFKLRDVVGVPGTGGYSGMLTFAPWGDFSGNKVHQLNLNDGGLFWRTGAQGSNWDSWQKLVLENDYGIGISDNKKLYGAYFQTNDYSVMTFLSRAWATVQGTNGKAFSFQTHYNNGVGGFEAMAIYYGENGKIVMAHNGGKVGIGTTDPKNLLDVNGTIHAREVKVDLTGWSDFVFHPSYQLKPLIEVEKFIKANGHLESIPSAAEVEQNGVNLGEMQKKLLEKVEELTLYVIEKDKDIANLKAEHEQSIEQLRKEIEMLKNK